jgi:mono/diheme cytochrome c family protein
VDLSLINVLFAFAFLGIIFSSCSEGTEGRSVPDLHKNAQINLKDIELIYRYKCSICHGKNGVSVIKGAPNLVTTEYTMEERVAIIMYGKGTMPPQKDVLDMPTIRGLAVYIDSLK